MVSCLTRFGPPEVVNKIFSHLSSPLRLLEPHKFPWYLGHICSEWRSVFLSMQPYFWNEIVLDQPEDYNKVPESSRVMAVLMFFLNATNGAPFSFSLFDQKENYYYNIEVVRLVLPKFLEFSAQWKNVSMKLWIPESSLLRSVKNRVPFLQSLMLMLPEPEESDQKTTLLQVGEIFEDAPLLTRVELNYLSGMGWKFNWTSLTSLRLHSFRDDPQIILATLQQTVNLEEFFLWFSYFDPDFEGVGNPTPIKLPRLKYLSIRDVFLFTILETPALRELKADFDKDLDTGRIMIDFLLRSSCKLSVLSLGGIESPSLIDILSYTPDLEKLSLGNREFFIHVVKWLTGSESTAGVAVLPLPYLNSLSFSCWSRIKGSDLEAVQEMVTRRNPTIDNGVERLQKLVIATDLLYDGSTAVLKSLESCCEDKGIEFQFFRMDPTQFSIIQLPISIHELGNFRQGLTRHIYMPPEVMREIFSYLSSPLRVLEAYKFPWYLGQVCSEWRNLFLSMQRQFWNEIEIERPKVKDTRSLISLYSPNEIEVGQHKDRDEQADTERTMAMLAFFLDATHGAPFTFSLYGEAPYLDKEVPYMRLVLSKLIEHSTQWEGISMQMQLPEFLLLHSIKNRLPNLKDMELILPPRHDMQGSNHDVTSLSQMSDIFEDAPLLTLVELRCLSDVPLRFNWASLTSLHLDSPDDPQTVVATLQQAANLVALTISTGYCHVNFEDVKIITLPRLEFLSTKGLFLFTILEAPELDCLEIELMTNNPHNSKTIIEFLHRSKCQLSSLSWKHPDSAVSLAEILRHTRHIEELSVYGAFSFGFLRWLSGMAPGADGAQPQKVPLRHLDSLTLFSYSRIGSRALKALQEMIIRRNSSDAEPLLELDLRSDIEWTGSDEVLEDLDSVCENAGIEFEFTICQRSGLL